MLQKICKKFPAKWGTTPLKKIFEKILEILRHHLYVCLMRKYSIFVRWEGHGVTSIIYGTLTACTGYYHVLDDSGKNHYYPMGRTLITQLTDD